MKESGRKDIPADLREVLQHFERWRVERKAGARIPEGLWSSAVEVAARHGVHRVCTLLGVNHTDLKDRLSLWRMGQEHGSTVTVRFVELPGADVESEVAPPIEMSARVSPSSSPSPSAPSEAGLAVRGAFIMLEAGNRARMVVQLPVTQPVSIAEVLDGFWARHACSS